MNIIIASALLFAFMLLESPNSKADDSAIARDGGITEKSDIDWSRAVGPSTRKRYVGEKIAAGNLEITLAVKTRERVGSEVWSSVAPEGALYIVVQEHLKNVGSVPVSDMPSIQIMDQKGTLYKSDMDASVSYASENPNTGKVLSDLNPGIAVDDASVFEISKDLFDINAWSVVIDGDTANPVAMQMSAVANNNSQRVPYVDTVQLSSELREKLSLDCSKAVGATARIACSDPEIGKLHAEHDALLRQAAETLGVDQVAHLLPETRQALRMLPDSVCEQASTTEYCRSGWQGFFRVRISMLNAMLASSPSKGAEPNLEQANRNEQPVVQTPAEKMHENGQLATIPQCDNVGGCVEQALAAAKAEDADGVRNAAVRIDALPKPPLGNQAVARQMNAVALDAFKRNDYEGAARQFRSALEENPRDVEIGTNLGFSLVKANKGAEATEVLVNALALNPRRTSTWTPLAEALALQDKPEDAKAALWIAFHASANREKSLATYQSRAEKETNPQLRALYTQMAKACAAILAGPSH